MENLLLILIIILVVLLIGVVAGFLFLHFRLREIADKTPDNRMLENLSQRLQDVDQSSRNSFERLAGTLGQLAESTRQMLEVGRTISNLEDLLKPPKLRGGMGETLLGELLDQIIPQNYMVQHQFRSGVRVDAVIRLGDGLVPIDAKFPLESFRRLMETDDKEIAQRERKEFVKQVKKHISDISDKYILPDEGTYEFALMYIPAENVYYETILKDDSTEGLFPYALEKHVIPVSPNSFYAYLQVIVHGLKGLRIEQRAKEIMSYLARLSKDEERFRQEFDTLGLHLTNATKKYDDAQRKLVQFEDKLLATGHDEQLKIAPMISDENDLNP